MFLRCFFSTTQIIRNFRIFRHAHLATGIVGIIRHLVVRPRTDRTWKTQVLKIIEEHYISVYTGIELNWKNASDSKQPRFVFMWYVYIGKLKKKERKKWSLSVFSWVCLGIIFPWIRRLSMFYMTCDDGQIMNDYIQKVVNIYHDVIQHRQYRIFPSTCG